MNARRISIIGTTGSGKSTIAGELSRHWGIPHIELDSLYWEENWRGVSDEVFRQRVAVAIQGARWIVDGNYSRCRDLVWARADTVVYLDYSFWRIFWQLLRRTFRRALQKEELWSGNREYLGKAFFSKDSILLWMLTTYHRRRRQYASLFQEAQYTHLRVVHLTDPKRTAKWLDEIKSGSNPSPGRVSANQLKLL